MRPEAISADPFLIVVEAAEAHASRTAWQAGPQAGLQFLQTFELGGEVPLQLRAIRRIWAELMPADGPHPAMGLRGEAGAADLVGRLQLLKLPMTWEAV